MAITKVTYSMIDGAMVNVCDLGAVGDGSNATAAFIKAAATGEPVWIPYGEYVIDQPVTFSSGLFGAGAGDTNVNGKTRITLTGSGQLIVGDWYCEWDGFEVCSSVNNKTMIVNPGKSYWTFTNYVISKIGAATGQTGIEFNLSSASVYFNRLDNLNIRCDYPVKVTGTGTQSFNANKIGMGIGGNKWFDFLSAITIDSSVAHCDANEFGGYFEAGTNLLSFNGITLRQNRFRLVADNVTRIWNSVVSVTDANFWEIADGNFTYQGNYPQNQIIIGQPETAIRATDTSSTPVIPSATPVTMTFDTEVFDPLSEFTPGTGTFKPLNAGYYQVDAQALTQSYTWPSGSRFEVQIYKNNTLYASGMYNASETSSVANIQRSGSITSILYMNGTTDTMTIKLLHNRGGNVSLDTSPSYNFINILRV